jgi:hypothetical protein
MMHKKAMPNATDKTKPYSMQVFPFCLDTPGKNKTKPSTSTITASTSPIKMSFGTRFAINHEKPAETF